MVSETPSSATSFPFSLRQDKGTLWENFLVSERQKRNHYSRYFANSYFWRTHAQKEIDYIEERNGLLTAFELNGALKKPCLHRLLSVRPIQTVPSK